MFIEYYIIAFFLIVLLAIALFKGTNEAKYLKLKYKELPHHIERSFFDALQRSSKEHGYSGFLSSFRFFLRRLFNHILQIISKLVPYSGFRVVLHRMRGVSIGKGAHIGPSVTIDDVYPNYVIIEKNASIAGLNFILTHTKPLEYHKELSKSYVAPVRIKENAWIAIGVILLPGVTVGKGSIVAAGSVVTESVPDNCFVGGCPAKLIKKIELEDGKPISFKSGEISKKDEI